MGYNLFLRQRSQSDIAVGDGVFNNMYSNFIRHISESLVKLFKKMIINSQCHCFGKNSDSDLVRLYFTMLYKIVVALHYITSSHLGYQN